VTRVAPNENQFASMATVLSVHDGAGDGDNGDDSLSVDTENEAERPAPTPRPASSDEQEIMFERTRTESGVYVVCSWWGTVLGTRECN
jgi:hypothetical protein